MNLTKEEMTEAAEKAINGETEKKFDDPAKQRASNAGKAGKGHKHTYAERPNRRRAERDKFNLLTIDKETNDIVMKNAFEVASLPKIDTNDPVQVRERSELYFSIVAKNGTRPTVAGYALALGTDRTSLFYWTSGQRTKPSEVVNILKTSLSIVNSLTEEYLQNGGINVVAGIFLMKNNHGYRDQQEVVVTPRNPMGDGEDTNVIEGRYAESVVPELPEKTE